jgi:hypothetical protein
MQSFFVPLYSFLLRFNQDKKLENLMSHEGVISFLVKVVAMVKARAQARIRIINRD